MVSNFQRAAHVDQCISTLRPLFVTKNSNTFQRGSSGDGIALVFGSDGVVPLMVPSTDRWDAQANVDDPQLHPLCLRCVYGSAALPVTCTMRPAYSDHCWIGCGQGERDPVVLALMIRAV